MPDTISLPFCVPWFAFTQGHAAPGLAMAGHPTAYNAVLNQCITLSCTRRFLQGYSSPQVFMPKSGIHSFDCLEKYGVTSRFGHPYFKEIIKQMLNEGFYIYFGGVDDYYLPGKSWYGTRHMAHDGVICGYDEADQTYSIAAYDINWVYNLIRIPQACFMEGLHACVQNEQYASIVAYRMKDIEVKLDEQMILKNIKEYIGLTVDRFSLENDGRVIGIAVQDFIVMYLDKLKDGSIPSDKMDWRSLRPIWEQKRCMVDRIRAIEEKRGWGPELSTQYVPLVEEANRVRMMYAMYHKNQKESLLDKMKSGILHFKDAEYEILQALIQRMEEEST